MKVRLFRALPFSIIALFMLYWPARFSPAMMYNGDELVKYAQTRGLVESGFRSESPAYPARNLDADFRFSPLAGTYIIKVKEKTTGPFPIAFSVLTAPLTALGGHTLPLFASILATLAFLIFLRRYWRVSTFVLVFAGLGTWMAVYGMFYSEVMFFLLLLFTGMSLFLKPFAQDSPAQGAGSVNHAAKTTGHFLLAGILMGLSTWFRLEGALFIACLGLGFIIARGSWNPFRDKPLLFTMTGAALSIFALLLLNYFLYEHPLGPRFLVNKQGFAGTMALRLRAMRVLLFMGDFKPGFFLYVPLIGLVFLNALRPRVFAHLDGAHRAMLIAALIFLPLASFLAPNDGVAGWGPRYLIAALPPGLLLLEKFLQRLDFHNRGRFSPLRLGLLAAAGFSILITILGLLVLNQGMRQLRAYQKDFRAVDAEIRVFQNQVLAGHLGLSYMNLKVLRAEDAVKLRALTALLRARAPGRKVAFHYKPVPPEMLKFAGKGAPFFLLTPEQLAAYKKVLRSEFAYIGEKKGKHSFASIYRIPSAP